MGSKHRKLFEKVACELCQKSLSVGDCSRYCKHPKSITFIVVASSLAAAALLVVCAYLFYIKYYKNRRARSSQPLQPDPIPDHHHNHAHRNHDRAVFVDEEHGPVVDHHIWYIRTVGLEQSLISSITVCQYKKDDGLVEGTECAVCLSEFQENETLRLLPKCDHAFHIPCIDTWLTSHTNCPMCRAPIVKIGGTTTLAAPPPPPNVVDANELMQESEVEIVEIERDESVAIGGVENEVCDDLGSEAGEAIIDKQIEMDVEPRRQSVSIDNSSANSKTSVAISNVMPVYRSKRGTEIAARQNVDNFQKLSRQKGTSSKWRSLQNGKETMKRSSSWNGKLLCMDVQNCDSVFPLRSF